MVNVTYPHALVVRDKRSDWDLSAGDLAICVYKGRGVLVDKIAEWALIVEANPPLGKSVKV